MKAIKRVIKIAVVVALIIHLINAVFFYKPMIDGLLNIEKIGISLMYSFIMTIICANYFDFLYKKLQWQNYGVGRLILGNIGSLFVALPAYFLCRLIHYVLIEGQSFSEFIASEKIKFYAFPFLFCIAITLFFQILGFYKALQEKKIDEQKIIAGTASAKFDALKNQLDPHFLFNSLNVLTSLIEENTDAAQKFTTSLSKVYRYVLEQKNKDLVPVTEELKFAKIYMSLLQMRFENSISLELPEQLQNPEAKIVPLSLQLLLENTVKHNVVMPTKPLHIKIFEKEGFLYVLNNLQPKAVLKTKSGVGLANIKQRYQLLTKREFSIEKTSNEFIAKLPVLTKKITSVMETAQPIEPINSTKYQKAREHVERIKGFYSNLVSYCLVIPALAIFNHITSPQFYWFFFPMFGWGFGVIMHGLRTFNYNIFLGKNWEDRKIQEFMEGNNFK